MTVRVNPKVFDFALCRGDPRIDLRHRVDQATMKLSRSGRRYRVFGAPSPKGATLFLPRSRFAFPHISVPSRHDRR
jgi:hypothetical protein